MTPATFTIDHEALHRFTRTILVAAGATEQHAADSADALVWANLRGVETHGVRNLKRFYVDGLTKGELNARPDFRIEHETPLSARIDGDRGLGMAAGCRAMRLVIEKARAVGVGLAAVRNSHHFGAAGYYAQMAVEHDMIGNAETAFLFAGGVEIGVPPTGSLQPMLSTNPISLAVPAGDEPTLLLDMATSIAPVNRVELCQELGKPIPFGWALDTAGKPTNDPEQAKLFPPLGGDTLLGGHKGYGLSLMVEVFSALLSGAWRSAETIPPPPQSENGSPKTSQATQISPDGWAQDGVAHFFCAMRIDLFQQAAEFRQGVDCLIRTMRSAPPAPGCERVCTPGEIEHETEQRRRREGIPLPAPTAEMLRSLASEYDTPLELVAP